MSSEIKNDIISNSNTDIMEYLIQKLESRQRNLSKCANIFNTIDSYETFYQKRKEIFILFKNLEEEIHQAAMAIKALMAQNKALSQNSLDTTSIQKNYNKLLQENNYLLIENNKYAQKLKELNHRSISPKSPNRIKRVKSPNLGGDFKSQFNYENKNINKYQPPMIKTNSVKKNKNNISNNNFNNYNINNNKKVKENFGNRKQYKNNQIINEDINNYNVDLDDINKLKNIKNIIKDMKNNKNKLKEVISEHFKTNKIQ